MGLDRGARNAEERRASLYNLQSKRLDSARADWSIMVTYSDFRAGCCTNLPFVLRLAENLTSRKFRGPGGEARCRTGLCCVIMCAVGLAALRGPGLAWRLRAHSVSVDSVTVPLQCRGRGDELVRCSAGPMTTARRSET